MEYSIQTTEEFKKGVGNTPLIKIESISKEINRNIYFKAEYLNSGKSIKDRAAIFLLEDAISKGNIQPGGTIVEATAGNTGIALALLGRSYNPPYKVRLYVPETLVEEKITILKELGAEVIKCKNVAQDHPEYVNNLAKKYAKETPNCFHVNQFDNVANRTAHFKTTGPEIYKELNGQINGFIVAAGTSGTFSGISQYLKSQDPNIKTYYADREGSGIFSYITSKGDNWDAEGESFVEGVGKLAPTGNMTDALELADGAIRIIDEEVIITIYKLIHRDGIRPGGSGGLNIAAARKLALQLPEGSTVVTTVADTSDRYGSKLFNKKWLIEKNYWDKIPVEFRYLASYPS